MSVVTLHAAAAITAGQAVRTTGSPPRVTPAVDHLRTRPFFGIALKSAAQGQKVDVQIGGAFGDLGGGPACAVGVGSSGHLVRATDPSCASIPNWMGDCDASGTVTVRPRRDTRLSVLDFGATGSGTIDDTVALQRALDAATKLVSGQTSVGKVVHLPPGDYRITAPLVVTDGCVLEGAGVAGATRVLADVANGDFNLSTLTDIGPVGGETVYCAIALVGYWTGQEMDPARGRADHCVLRQFSLISTPHQGPFATALHQQPQMDGVRVMAHGPWIEKLKVEGFRRSGITVYASYPPTFTPQVNANNTQVRDCLLTTNGQDGLDIGSGGNDDANVILVMNVDATGNGRCGINDRSFLGCTFVSCHTSANRYRNYNCNRHGSPTYSAYFGCYAEMDAPSLFKGPVAVVGGDLSNITPDSYYWGFVPISRGPSSLHVMNSFSSVRNYPGTGSGYGVSIDKDEVHTPGNGHKYRAVNGGRTYGKWRNPVESPPVWPTTPGQMVTEFDGLVWECLGPYIRAPQTFNTLGGTTPAVIQDYGYLKADDTSVPFFRTEASSLTHAEGRLLTHLTSGVSFHSYFQSTYESGPVPGAFILPQVWVGSYYYGERRIGVAYTGTPYDSPVGSCGYYMPGDLLLNARQASGRRQGGIGWVVKAPCARRSTAQEWSPNKHYLIGQTVRPSIANGRVYRLTKFINGVSYPLKNLSGGTEPQWSAAIGGVTPDHQLQWQTLYDLDDPANAWAVEPLPQRAKAQADSTAADLPGLVADFNALLAKMRAADLLEP